jgi:AcrR family transcriptional regulator
MVRSLQSSTVQAQAPRRPSLRKRANHYHHGDLRRALINEAVRTIRGSGVEQLTLRGVGATLGVSRTALYRHFADKSALLAAVAREGFHRLRVQLIEAWDGGGRGREGFEAMGVAYVRFAIAHPSHYRVMFGSFVEACAKDVELAAEASAAFQVLVDALVAQQKASVIVRDDPLLLAQFVWAVVHGVAMLAIDGPLRGREPGAERLIAYAVERIRASLEVSKT